MIDGDGSRGHSVARRDSTATAGVTTRCKTDALRTTGTPRRMSDDPHPMEELMAAGAQHDSPSAVPTPEYVVQVGIEHVEQEVFVVRLNNDEYAVALNDLERLLEDAQEKLNQDTEETEIDL